MLLLKTPNRALTFLGAMFLSADLSAGIINVPGDHSTILTAINNSSSRDEIVVAPNTYNHAINFIGEAITVRWSARQLLT